jgi:sodium/hydrogen antiporter
MLSIRRLYHTIRIGLVPLQRKILPLRSTLVIMNGHSAPLGALLTFYAVISLLAGVTFSPNITNLIRPLEYAGSEANLKAITLCFSRLVLGVQLVLAGVQLPSRYLQKEWKSLAVLLGPAMTSMWLISSLIMWAVVPDLPFLHALAIAACITPTDPILSNTIVKGKFADRHVPKPLQNIIIAESGANDGLGYPFLFLALYLIKYNYKADGASTAMRLWFGETWGYTIILSVVYGALIGWFAKELLHWAEEKKFVDRESFLVFAIALALFIVGTCGMAGSDDVLACFVAGNTFTWDVGDREEISLTLLRVSLLLLKLFHQAIANFQHPGLVST